MAGREEVMNALRELKDPELHRSMMDLNMIRDVKLHDGTVDVTVALTIKGCPLRTEIQRMVEEKLLALPGIREARVNLTTMTDEERQELFGGNRLQQAPILAPNSPTRIIGVASGKGGVGKSTVTVNLAAAMARLGHAVGVLDADVYGFSVPRMLGLSGQPTAIEGKILPMPAYGMKVISMGMFVQGNRPIVWRGPMLGKVLQQFLTDVLWGDPDYLLVDMPPGTGDMALDVARMLPRARLLIVSTPQNVAAGVASRAALAARTANQEVLGVVENMSYFVCPGCSERSYIFGEGGGEALARELGVPLLGRIPLTMPLRRAGDDGVPIVHREGNGEEAQEAFMKLAKAVAAAVPVAARQA